MTKTNGNKPSVEFDLNKLTAFETEALNAAERNMRFKDAAVIYARIVVQCPAEWGEPDKPETYGNLPIATFMRMSQQLGDTLKNELAG